ncbi:hypothetical protein D3C86_2064710 [compost metagenome]
MRIRLVKELKWIHQQKSVTLKSLMGKFALKELTAKRDVKILKDGDLIEFIGARKSGRYILTDKGQAIFVSKDEKVTSK